MKQIKERIQNDISQIKDIISTLIKPIGNDFTNLITFSSEGKLIRKLETLTELATTTEQLDVISGMIDDIKYTLKTKIQNNLYNHG